MFLCPRYHTMAKERGVRFGRPAKPLPENFEEVYKKWRAGAITGTTAAKECQMSQNAFRSKVQAYEKECK